MAGILAVGMIPAAAFADDVVDDTTADVAAEELVEAPEAEEAAIELETQTAAEAFAAATFVAGTDADGSTATPAASGSVEFTTVPGAAHFLKVTKLSVNGADVDVTDATKYTQSYALVTTKHATNPASDTLDGTIQGKTAAEIEALAKASSLTPGQYRVTITRTEDSAVAYVYFTINPASPQGIQVKQTSFDTEGIKYDGTTLFTALKFFFDEKTELATTGGTQAIDVTFYQKAGSEWAALPATGTSGLDADEPIEAGDYIAEIKGHIGTIYDGTEAVRVPFTVSPLTLSDSTVTLTGWATKSAKPAETEISITDGKTTVTGSATLITVATKSTPDGSGVVSESNKGHYEFEVSPYVDPATNKANPNVVGKATVSYDTYATQIAATGTASTNFFRYNGQNTWFASNAVTVNLSLDADSGITTLKKFDTTLLKAYKVACDTAAAAANEVPVTSITVTDKDGKAATVDDINTPGIWDVTIKAESTDGKIGGTAKVKVTTIAEALSGAKIAVSYKGAVSTSGTATYTGSDLSGDIKVVVKDAKGKELVKGTDYDYEFVGEDGKVVTSIVDAGTYTLRAKSTKYVLDDDANDDGTPGDYLTLDTDPSTYINNEYKFTVKPVQPVAVRLGGLSEEQVAATATDPAYLKAFYQYTGNAIAPVVEYTTDGKEWKALDASAYSIASISYKPAKGAAKTVTEIKDAGTYTITLGGPAKANKNFDVKTYILDGANTLDYTGTAIADKGAAAVTGKVFIVEVADDATFIDVTADKWYFEEIEKANELGYMTGTGKKQFSPNGTVTRGMAATIIYKMAGNTGAGDEDEYSNQGGTATKFSDVDGGMWYAKPIAWAAKMGIVNGYSGKKAGTFGPEDPVTREQFACMLQRYADSVNKYKAPASTDLSAYADGSKVSSWATKEVAWAVDAQIMGKDKLLNPQGKIKRSEAAAMVVRYQPNKLGEAAAEEPEAAEFGVTTAADYSGDGHTIKIGSKDVSTEDLTTAVDAKIGTTITVTTVATGTVEAVANGATIATDTATSGTATITFNMPAGDVVITVS